MGKINAEGIEYYDQWRGNVTKFMHLSMLLTNQFEFENRNKKMANNAKGKVGYIFDKQHQILSHETCCLVILLLYPPYITYELAAW